jgi:hypothetical protein
MNFDTIFVAHFKHTQTLIVSTIIVRKEVVNLGHFAGVKFRDDKGTIKKRQAPTGTYENLPLEARPRL